MTTQGDKMSGHIDCQNPDCGNMLKRIADLEKELAEWKTWGVIEVMVRNPNVNDYVKQLEKDIKNMAKDCDHCEQKKVQEIIKILRDLFRADCLAVDVALTGENMGDLAFVESVLREINFSVWKMRKTR